MKARPFGLGATTVKISQLAELRMGCPGRQSAKCEFVSRNTISWLLGLLCIRNVSLSKWSRCFGTMLLGGFSELFFGSLFSSGLFRSGDPPRLDPLFMPRFGLRVCFGTPPFA